MTLWLALPFALAVTGCSKEPAEGPNDAAGTSGHAKYADDPQGMTVLGPERPNPYTTENMMAAFEELRASGVEPPEGFQVRTTHRYVRYHPERWEQYVQLHQDEAHIFFDHPLDREVEQAGNYYHEREVADEMPEYQYAALEMGYRLDNGIPYEVLAELYIPEQDEAIMRSDYADQLLSQAFSRLGVPEDDGEDQGGHAKASWYTPAGQVLINDDRLGQNIGLEGVLVTARRWFTTHTGRTNFSGNYSVNGQFKHPCNYRMHFEAPGFQVRHNLINIVAYVDGPKQTGNWNTTLGAGSYNNFAGTVFRGAFYYHFKNIDGLTRPFLPGGGSTTYIAKDAAGTAQGVNWGVVPVIKIWRGSYSNDEVFSTTVHETAHLTHILVMGNIVTFGLVASKVRESWAVGVEWRLTSMEYQSRGIANYAAPTYYSGGLSYPLQYGYQYWNSGVDGTYTNLFIDCQDYFNELGVPFANGYPTGSVNDRIGRFQLVNGNWQTAAATYSIASLENNVIRFSLNLNDVSSRLKLVKPFGVTNSDIDLLIASY